MGQAEAPAAAPAVEAAEAAQARQARQATEEEGSPVTEQATRRKRRDAFVIGLAQNAILVGLFILAAGVPTW